jgi:hypothetical protein
MNATLLYRIASALLIFFAAGHTIGFLSFKPPTAEGIAVRDAMQNVQFKMGSGTYTYNRFYKGFGLFCTAYLCSRRFWRGNWVRWRAAIHSQSSHWHGCSLVFSW